MAKRCSAEALVRAVRRDRLDCDVAIDAHLNDNYRGPLAVPSLPKVWLALCSANMGWHKRVLDLPDGPMSVAQVIEEFGLAPFLPLFDRQERASFGKGDVVSYRGGSYRVIGMRKVTPFAMPRCDDCELFIEAEDRSFGSVGESEVEAADG